MNERLEWVTDADDFDALREAWDDLAAGDPTPFSRHDWFAAWWRAFGASGQPEVCAAWRDGQLVGALPLQSSARARFTAMANYHTPVFRPLFRDPAALRAVVEAALRRASVLELSPLVSEDAVLASMVDQSRSASRLVLLDPAETAPIVETSGEFEHYRQEMKAGWREIERRRRKLLREHDVQFSLIEPPDELERDVERAFDVEASGWKGTAGTAILSSEETRTFYRSIARAYHGMGKLVLSGVTVDGRPAACDFALLHRNRYYLLKTGYDEAFRKSAPGLLLRLSVIERCFESGIEAHEFLGHETEWKSLFATGGRRHETFRSYRRTPIPAARYGYRRSLVPLLKRARSRTRFGVAGGR